MITLHILMVIHTGQCTSFDTIRALFNCLTETKRLYSCYNQMCLLIVAALLRFLTFSFATFITVKNHVEVKCKLLGYH